MQTAKLDLLDVDPFDLIEDEEPFAPTVKVDAAASVAELLGRALRVIADFDESKHKRDRRGRFSKSATQMVSELDDLMAKLSALTGALGDDEDDKYDADAALETLKAIRDRRHARLNRHEATLDIENGEVRFEIDADGDIQLNFDNGGFYMPATEAKQLAGVLDGFRATKLPEKRGADQAELARVPLGDDGEIAAVLWDRGLVEIGPADNVGGEELNGDVLLLEDFDEVADFTDLLEELADRSINPQVKAKFRRVPRRLQNAAPVVAHLLGQHDQRDHAGGRKKSLPSAPKVDVPKAPRKKAEPKAKPERKATALKAPAQKRAPHAKTGNVSPAGAPTLTRDEAQAAGSKATKASVTAHLKGLHNQQDHAGGSVASQVRSESRRSRRKEFVQANDPLGAMAWHLADLTADDFVGSGRVGGEGEVGVDLVATMDSGGFRSLRVGVGARADNALETDEIAVLSDTQISKLHGTLTAARQAADASRGFDEVVDGEDNGDVRVTVDEGARDVRVSAHSWAAQESASEDWDPVLEKEHILGRWPTRDDFSSAADFDRYLDYGGFDSADDYLGFTRKSPYEPDTSDEMTPKPGSAAVLTTAQVGELTSVIERLQRGRPWREERSGEPAPVTGAPVEVDAKYDPHQLRNNQGEWATMPGGGARDTLKLAGRIQVGEGEKLLSSRKLKSSSDDTWDLLAAEVETPTGREVRLGVIHPDDTRSWSAGSSERRDRQRLAELDALLDQMDEDDKRYDDLQDERAALDGSLSEVNKTGALTPSAVAELHSGLAAGVEEAKAWAKRWDKFWEDHADLSGELQDIYGTRRRLDELNADEQARVQEIQTQLDVIGDPHVRLAEGSIPAGGGSSVEYVIVAGGDDSPATWRVDVGVRSPDDEENWFPGFNDDAARFEPQDVRALLKNLNEMAGGAVAASTRSRQLPDRMSAAAGADVTPGNDELHHWWTRGPGKALWAESPEPWTTLVSQLMEHVEGLTLDRAKRWASRWYIEVFGYSANSDKARVAHGKPPRGKVIGPG